MESLYGDFGRRVRDARRQAGLSQQTVADRVGLSRTSITNIERGRQHVALHMLFRLAAAVGKDPGELLPARSPTSEDGMVDPYELRGLQEEQREWIGRVLGQVSGKSRDSDE